MELFAPHHYLTREVHPLPASYVGLIKGRPAVFTAVILFPHAKRPGWREHRMVTLPDYQGALGNRMSETIAPRPAAVLRSCTPAAEVWAGASNGLTECTYMKCQDISLSRIILQNNV
jgi:hypothetical protein